jgi:hypothetical protein
MRKLRQLVSALCSNQRGDVLLEYVLITTSIILPLVSGVDALFNPSGINDSGQADFGYVGKSFLEFYQRIVCGIGLPVP